MFGPMKVIQSRSGMNYIGLKARFEIPDREMRRLASAFKQEHLRVCFDNRFERDGAEHHITIVSPHEFESLSSREVGFDLTSEKPDLKFGSVTALFTATGTVIFVPVESTVASLFRSELGLGTRDFHITLGFSPRDNHNVRKSQRSLARSYRYLIEE